MIDGAPQEVTDSEELSVQDWLNPPITKIEIPEGVYKTAEEQLSEKQFEEIQLKFKGIRLQNYNRNFKEVQQKVENIIEGYLDFTGEGAMSQQA